GGPYALARVLLAVGVRLRRSSMQKWVRVHHVALIAAGLTLVSMARPAAAADNPCGQLLIVLDRSGSMAMCKFPDGSTKESVAKSVVKKVLAQYPTLPAGLVVFPDTTGGCSDSNV